MKKRATGSSPADTQTKEAVGRAMSALEDLLWANDILQANIKSLREEIKSAYQPSPPAENQPPIMRADVLDLCRQLDEECDAKNRALAWAAELEDRLRAVGEKPPRRRKSGSAQGDVARWPAPRKKK